MKKPGVHNTFAGTFAVTKLFDVWPESLLSRDLLFLTQSQCLKINQKSFQFSNFDIFQKKFVLLKLTCLVTLFDYKHHVLKSTPKWTIFYIFIELLSTQNANVARFARNIKWDFLCDFQTPLHKWCPITTLIDNQ